MIPLSWSTASSYAKSQIHQRPPCCCQYICLLLHEHHNRGSLLPVSVASRELLSFLNCLVWPTQAITSWQMLWYFVDVNWQPQLISDTSFFFAPLWMNPSVVSVSRKKTRNWKKICGISCPVSFLEEVFSQSMHLILSTIASGRLCWLLLVSVRTQRLFSDSPYGMCHGSDMLLAVRLWWRWGWSYGSEVKLLPWLKKVSSSIPSIGY